MDTLDTNYQEHTGFHYDLNSRYATGFAKKSLDGRKIYWYVNDKGPSNKEASAAGQFNSTTGHYYWLAIG